LNGVTFNLIGNSGGTVEGTVAGGGNLAVGGGQTVINLTNNGGTLQLNLGTLTTNAGSAINFTSNAQLGTASNQVLFSTAPRAHPGHHGHPRPRHGEWRGHPRRHRDEFATYGANGIAAYTAYNNSGPTPTSTPRAPRSPPIPSSWAWVFITAAADDLNANRSFNAINIAAAASMSIRSAAT